MKKLTHAVVLKPSARTFLSLRRLKRSALYESLQSSYRYTSNGVIRQMTNEEEEELVYNLVQDPFNPGNIRSHCSDSVYDQPAKDIPHSIGSAHQTVCMGKNGQTKNKNESAQCFRPSNLLSIPNTHLPNVIKRHEKFLRVRLRSNVFTSDELKDPTKRESRIDWMCMDCQSFNSWSCTSCQQCGSREANSYRERYAPERHVVSFPELWMCEKCGGQNCAAEQTNNSTSPVLASPSMRTDSSKFFCVHCTQPFGGVREWYCPHCDHINSKASMQCSMCFAERPPMWKCHECNYTCNSIFSTACFKCEKHRPMKVSNSTLVCLACGTRNNCRWELCEACMSPLPALIESRQMKKIEGQPTLEPSHFPSPDMSSVTTLSLQHTLMAEPRKSKNCSRENDSTKHPIPLLAGSSQSAPLVADINSVWWCAQCNIIQRRNATFCDVCLHPRHLAEEAPVLFKKGKDIGEVGNADTQNRSTRDPMRFPAVGSWQCPYCREFRKPKELRCCGKLREIRKGYWICQSCCSVNRKERRFCIGCNISPVLSEYWACALCELRNTADNLLCQRCGTENEFFWSCPSCHILVPQSKTVCSSCTVTKPAVPVPIICRVCQAPNAPLRATCFRCRSRLQFTWECVRCQARYEDRTLVRCLECHTPHIYNEAEENWICELCGSAIASGGDLPVRHQCPKCRADRVKECLSFPSRWRCVGCGIFNRTASSKCVECNANRCMPVGFRLTVTCPQCFKQKQANAKEQCTNCGYSLSDILTDAAAAVHITPAQSIPYLPPT